MPDPVRRSRKPAHPSGPRSTPAKAKASLGRRGRVPVATDPPRRRRLALDGDERLERLTLIQFDWEVGAGIQPVILASRRLLH